jgi:hypothetical protein
MKVARWLVASWVVLGGCGEPVDGRDQAPGRYASEVVFTTGGKIGGSAIGDVDPRSPGPEIVAVSSEGEGGRIHVARREGGAWVHEVAATTDGEPIQVAVGDVDPAHPGDEIVAVGMARGGEDGAGAGAVYHVARAESAWAMEVAFVDTALVHGVAVADADPDRPGLEVVAVGFSERATLLWRDGGAWRAEPVAQLGSAGKSATAFQGGVVVACTGGTLMHVRKGPDGWSATALDAAPAGQSRVASDGTRVLAARDDGALGLWADGVRRDVYASPQKLRGAVLADLDPESPGLEAATAGYDGKVVVLRASGDAWTPEVVHDDGEPFHTLAVGDLLEAPGLELVTGGFGRRLVLVSRRAAR